MECRFGPLLQYRSIGKSIDEDDDGDEGDDGASCGDMMVDGEMTMTMTMTMKMKMKMMMTRK